MKKLIVLLVFWIGTLSSAWATQHATFPAYQFQSTSTCPSVVGQSAYTTTSVQAPYSIRPGSVIRRTESWSPGSWEDDGDGWGDPGSGTLPTGVIPDVPVGEPFVLLLMALLYALGHCIATRKKHSITN